MAAFLTGKQADAGRDWSQTRSDGALGASAVRRQNCQFARRKESSPSGNFRLVAAWVGLHCKRGNPDSAVVTGGRVPVRRINGQAGTPCGTTDFADSSE